MAIIVNATALNSGGGLTILKQFVKAIPNDEIVYYVFISDSISFNNPNSNVQFIEVKLKSFIDRFYWDLFGVSYWIKKNNVKPQASLSLQNTNFRVNTSVPNFIYFHNALVFNTAQWNIFDKRERTLWFYKNIYPLYIQLSLNKNSYIFVQSLYVKQQFSKKFNFPLSKIFVIEPTVEIPELKRKPCFKVDLTQVNLFYPSAFLPHKNHKTLFNALCLLDKSIQEMITLNVTISQSALDYLIKNKVYYFKLNLLGDISLQDVFAIYQVSDALVFPSFIETVGLPLLEASALGLPILVSDLEYSRELLNDYEGVVFIENKDTYSWAKSIERLISLKNKEFTKYVKYQNKDSWKYLFDFINNINLNELERH